MHVIRSPLLLEGPQRTALWQEHFGGPRRLALPRDKALVLKRQGDRQIAGQIFWQDCRLRGKPVALLYGFCVRTVLQRQGLGTALLEYAHAHLKGIGYSAAVLVPQEASLASFYGGFGYRPAGAHDSFFAKADGRAALRPISLDAYRSLRRSYMPENGLELPRAYLRANADAFYQGDGFLCAIRREYGMVECPELLGDLSAAGGIASALGLPHLYVQVPGTSEPDAMLLDFDGSAPATVYLGFAPE